MLRKQPLLSRPAYGHPESLCASITQPSSYFSDFYDRQRLKVRDKIIWTIWIIEHLQQVPEDYLKHLEDTDGLYEMRIQQGSDIFRIFCFFDEGQLVVLANGYQKKTQRTPKTEIDKALRIKNQYEQEK